MLLGGSTGCGRTTMINKFVAGLQMEKSLHPPTLGVQNYTNLLMFKVVGTMEYQQKSN